MLEPINALQMYVADRDSYWWVNQTGIVLEIVGALLVVVAAFKTRSQIKDIVDSWDAQLPERLRDVISSQAFTELRGFSLLALGLVLQLVGGFGS